jgi:ADP-ribose pyrophosphatase YjhB (NUDIX family)
MSEFSPLIRNTARAVILRDEAVLVLRKEGGGRDLRFALPGGGQEVGESLVDALQRECEEEIATRVDVGPLLRVAEFNKLRDTLPPSRRHLVEFLFQCSLPTGYQPRSGHHPDKHQVGVEWLPLAGIETQPLFPGYLASCLAELHGDSGASYLGWFEDRADP